MAWAQEMKSLVSDIKTSTRGRLQFVRDNRSDTHELLSRFDKELKDMAQDLKDFLDKSEKDRMSDFREMIKGIQGRVKSIADETKDFLAKSEQNRMADFRASMKDIQSRIDSIQKHVADLLSDYGEERKEAHAHWGMLSKGKRAVAAEEEAEEPKKVEKKAKKHKAE